MPTAPPGQLIPIDFADLQGWRDDDHAEAWRAFRQSAAAIAAAPPKTRLLGVDGEALSKVAAAALAEEVEPDCETSRRFFEHHFRPHRIDGAEAFFTGYYEPEAEASLDRRPGFDVPLYRVPEDLVEIDEHDPAPGLEAGMRFGRRAETGFEPYFDRGAIERGALDGQGLELAWLASRADAFFIHIQGAARLRLRDGSLMRVTYAAKSGHAYTPLGRVLIESGALPKGGATMQTIRAWLAENPQAGLEAMWRNRSFIFFRDAAVEDPSLGPIAAAKVPLTAGRSLAVDRTLHTFHVPIWIETRLPAEEGAAAYDRLVIAQDTGSAILGPARGDIFFGSGDAAGRIAGRMQSKGRFILLLPRRTE